jgi:hypothetical protein
MSASSGGSVLEGFADGALSGAVTGAIMGAAAAGGTLAGSAIKCGTKLAQVVKNISVVTRGLSGAMDGFDMLSMGLGMLDPDNVLTGFNNKLHSSVLYGGFQLTVNAVAVFTGVASTKIMCFVAGTMVLAAGGVAAGGLIAIETIKAGKLKVGDQLITQAGVILEVTNHEVENCDTLTMVYNFQVEDFHTHYVGSLGILVHNESVNTVASGNVVKPLKPQNYMDELAHSGQKHTAKDVISITKTPEGKLVWLEKGNTTSGLEHVMKHANEFATKGISAEKVPEFLMEAVSKGKIVSMQGTKTIYEVIFDGTM